MTGVQTCALPISALGLPGLSALPPLGNCPVRTSVPEYPGSRGARAVDLRLLLKPEPPQGTRRLSPCGSLSDAAGTPARSTRPGLYSSRAAGGSRSTSGSFQGRARKGVDGGRGKRSVAPGSRLTGSAGRAGERAGPRWAAPGYLMDAQECQPLADRGRRPRHREAK